MADKVPSKADQVKALREARHSAKISGGVRAAEPAARGSRASGGAAVRLGSPSLLEARMPSEAKRKRGRPLAKDRDKTLTSSEPWKAEGMSKATWYRRQKEKQS